MRRLALLVLLCCATVVFAQTTEKKETAKAPEASKAAKAKMVGEITAKQIPAMTAATVMEKASDFMPKEGYKTGMEGIGQAYTLMLTDAYTKLGAWMKSGGMPTGPSFAIYYEDPTKTAAKDLTTKVGFPTMKDAKGTEPVKIEEMPAHEAAVAQFSGPYEGSDEIYGTLFKWIGEKGYQVAGAPREIYLKSEHDQVKPEEYLTEIQVPVVKGAAPKAAEEKKIEKKEEKK